MRGSGGDSSVIGTAHHPFITGSGGIGTIDLNSPIDLPHGMVLTSALGINNAGQLILIAQVIREPETYAMFLAGLGLSGSWYGGSVSSRRSGLKSNVISILSKLASSSCPISTITFLTLVLQRIPAHQVSRVNASVGSECVLKIPNAYLRQLTK